MMLFQRSFGAGAGTTGEVWTTHSEISGSYFGIIFGADVTRPFAVGPKEAGFNWVGFKLDLQS